MPQKRKRGLKRSEVIKKESSHEERPVRNWLGRIVRQKEVALKPLLWLQPWM